MGFLCRFLGYARQKIIGHMLLLKSVCSCSQSIIERCNHCKRFQWREKEERMKGRNTTSEQQGSGWRQVILCATSRDSCLIFQMGGLENTQFREHQLTPSKRGSGGRMGRRRVNNAEVTTLQHTEAEVRKRAWDTGRTTGRVFRPVARKLAPQQWRLWHTAERIENILTVPFCLRSLTHTLFPLCRAHFRAQGTPSEAEWSHLNRNHAHRKVPRQKRGTLLETKKCVCVCVCVYAEPPVTTDYRHAPQMASASRLFTATPARIMARGCPSFWIPFLFWQHVCPSNRSVRLGQWQPDKEPAYPLPGCWIGGHVGLVIEGTIGRERKGVALQHPGLLGVAWCSLGGHSSDLNSGPWRKQNTQN